MWKLILNPLLKTFAAVCLLFPRQALAIEKILNFDSTAIIRIDGSVAVTEEITVRHEGLQIRRGIFRDLPTTKGESYKVTEVLRNGNPEPYFIEQTAEFYRINTGNDDFLPHPSTSTFQISYVAEGVLKHSHKYDEIYWNVTGDQWQFMIEKATFTILLPTTAEIIQQASYYGKTGSRQAAISPKPGVFVTGPLEPGNQLTAAVGFTPGIVSIPFFRKQQLLAVIGLFLGLVYFLMAWYKYGRDPAPRAIMPDFKAPETITPLQAAYIDNQGNTPRNLLLLNIISLAHSGYLAINKIKEKSLLGTKDVYTITPLRKPQNKEEHFYNLHAPKNLKLDGSKNVSLGAYVQSLDKKLKAQMENTYYHSRILALIGGLLLIFGFGSIFVSPTEPFRNAALMCIFLLISTRCSIWFGLIAGSLLLGLISIIFFGSLYHIGFLYLAIACLIGLVFSNLLFQPTIKGQRTLEKLQGLKMFLKATGVSAVSENEPLDIDKMEKLFPFAVALGLEKQWEKTFKDRFGEAAIQAIRSHNYYSASFSKSFSRSISSSGGSLGGSDGSGSAGGGSGGGGGGGR